MNKLTRKEEELMQILWDIKKGFVKDILDRYPDPKPHYNTVSSIVRLLQDKGFIGHKEYGNTHEYYPKVAREEYRKHFIKYVIRDYFDGSYRNVVTYFVEEEKIKPEDLDEIIKMIRNKRQ
ncbi:MAG: BlaI/MecI/CopY family transcriptional regulator [Bacteroidales bacterium]|nr:BlaI/MecI/CopY family transcriptional regulator [Bacteroidales bacterium]